MSMQAAEPIPPTPLSEGADSSSKPPRVYLAGPDVFFPDAADRFAALQALCAAAGLEGVTPVDGAALAAGAASEAALAERICQGNLALIRGCDAVLAHLCDFRGLEPDSGTVFEVAFAHALGKPVAGYGVPAGSYAERVRAARACVPDAAGHLRELADGTMVEGLGQPLNLMLSRTVMLADTPADGLRRLGAALQARESAGGAPARQLYILKAGSTLAELRERQGDFEDWIARGLQPARTPVRVHEARDAVPLPDAAQVAGVVVTGSHAMVSHREAWSEAAASWLAGLVRQGVPVLGICFGHQLLAHALGGVADDNPGGLELGTVEIDRLPAATDDALLGGLPARFSAHTVHRQSALALPPGAVPLASNGHDRHHAYRVGSQAWGVQFHPEFDESAMRQYVRAFSSDDGLLAAVRPTPEAASLLQRFGALVDAREAAEGKN